MKIVATNRKALRDFTIFDKYEAGIQLYGTEVKSARTGGVSLHGGYAAVENGQVYLYESHIAPYAQGNIFNHDPKRRRKLLLNKDEIKKLYGKVAERGFTLIPMKFYFNKKGWAKIELALCKGKKIRDIREKLKERAVERAERTYAKARRRLNQIN